jgi:hypothetical protein
MRPHNIVQTQRHFKVTVVLSRPPRGSVGREAVCSQARSLRVVRTTASPPTPVCGR